MCCRIHLKINSGQHDTYPIEGVFLKVVMIEYQIVRSAFQSYAKKHHRFGQSNSFLVILIIQESVGAVQ